MYVWLMWLIEGSPAFVTRDRCGAWGPWLPWVYQIASLLIAFSYFTIPVGLIYVWLKKNKILPAAYMYLLFGLFILLCGLTHIANAATFYYPAYRLITLIIVLTSVASTATAIVAPKAAMEILSLPSTKEYTQTLLQLNKEAETRETIQKELQRRNDALRREADKMRDLIEQLQSRQEMSGLYMEMRRQLHEIRDPKTV